MSAGAHAGKPTTARHTVERIHFTAGADGWNSQDAPIVCACQWSGTVREWEKHRGKLPQGSGSYTLGPAPMPSEWRRRRVDRNSP